MGEYNPTAIIPEKFFYVDLESVEGTILKSFREEKKISAPSRAQRLAQKGDIFFQAVRPYQKNNYLFDFDRNDFVFSTGYIQIRPNIDSRFLLSVVQKQTFIDKVMERSTGTSYPAINASDFKKIGIYFPNSLAEQKAIGGFFRQLDSTIDFHQREWEKYKNLKISYLDKIFPRENENEPQLRFSGFSDAWVQRKLGDVFNQTVNFIDPNESNVELYSLTVEKGLAQKEDRYNRSFLVTKTDKFKLVLPNEFAYNPMNITLGAFGLNSMGKSIAISGYYVTMSINPSFDNYYLKTWLVTEPAINLYKSSATGTLTEKQRVQFPTFAKLPIFIPSIAEQQAIGEFFRQLDDTITTHQRELEKYKKLKEGYLQKMFV